MRGTTMAQRIAVALHINQQKKGVSINFAGINPATAQYSPLGAGPDSKVAKPGELATMAPALGQPDYFGVANWANSPLPALDTAGAVIPGTGMRKFVDTLPGLCGVSAPNDLGQCIPLGVPDQTTFTGADYYEIAVVQYREQMHADLPATGTLLRGYVQVSSTPTAFPLTNALLDGTTVPIVDASNNPVYGVTKPHYLGPTLVTTKDRPVRIKFTNYLPTGPGGDLIIPMDNTYMGAGMGPGGSLTKITITNPGVGYTSAPAVAFSGGGGTGAAATAAIMGGAVVKITITDGGSGYTSAPTVALTGGGFTTIATATAELAGQPGEMYAENRATLHLHGGNTPWISDGTPHQWTTPAGELTSYHKGVSTSYVPDMWFDANGNLLPASSGCQGFTTCAVAGASNDPGLGSMSFFWTNQQTGRLLFYHDHAYGITRLNVYAGEAAGYLITDPVQEDALAAAGLPGTLGTTADLAHVIPLVIQDKTFVPDDGLPGGQLAGTDPTWDVAAYGGKGSLWFPHVYTPNQNPADVMGANAYGRWDYGPWFWPPQNTKDFVGKPYQCTSAAYPAGPAFPPLMCPGIPNPSGTPEGFLDTPVINGTAYPSLTVDPTAYRFHILTAGNDRTLNLGLYVADPLSVAVTNGGSGYTAPPAISFTGGGGGGAVANAVMSGGSVTGILLSNVGAGYTAAPTVTILGNGTGATASAVLDPLGSGTLTGISITAPGTGYSYATATIDPPSGCTPGPACVQAAAAVTVTPAGTVVSIDVVNPGFGWTSNPTVVFTPAAGDTTGAGAVAVASVNTEVKMVGAVPPMPNVGLQKCGTDNPVSGANLVLALIDASGNPLNGTGLPSGCWPSSWPTDGRDGGVPDPTTAGPPIIQIGTEGGILPNPVVIPSTPMGYEYNRRSITVLNVFNHGLTLGPAERADVAIDFSKYAGKTLIVYNDAPAPVPAFDSRTDYYTGDPDQTMAGGAPSTLPGYGPNTRTIMQIKVNAGTNPALSVPALQTAIPSIFATVQKQIIVPEPGFPVGNGFAATPTYLPIQATSLTSWIGGPVGSLTLTNGGSGYAFAPTANITGGGGTGAAASVQFTGAFVTLLTLNNGGAGYSSAPSVNFTNGAGDTTGGGAAATALFSGGVGSVAVLTAGSGYTSLPTVSFTGGGGTGAAAAANLKVNTINVTNGGANYTNPPALPPAVTISAPPAGGVQATATAVVSGGRVTSITVTDPGAGYTSRPTVAIAPPPAGTGARTATAAAFMSVNAVVVTLSGAGYTAAPTVTISAPGGGGVRATAAATLSGSVTGLLLSNGGAGYTANPTVGFTGGGTPTTPAAAIATILPGTVTGLTLTNGGTGYTSAPSVAFDPGAGNPLPAIAAAATANPPVSPLLPKAIQELFTLDYGRMNATFGVEVPFTNFLTQTTIPYGYIDPPTEMMQIGDTQFWKITHNGVDTHFIHFHLQDVQVINRVGWDGMIKPPDVNEMAWKDTVRMNPLEDIIVAVRPVKQVLPWELPNSVRPLDVTEPIGSGMLNQFTNIDTNNQPVTVLNDITNFGWEYVWHCHILGHEENDMMRALVLAVPPDAPTNVTATQFGTGNTQSVVVTWVDNAINETGFTVERATNLNGPWDVLSKAIPASPGTLLTGTYTDTTMARRTTYYYRVTANNLVGYTRSFAAPAVGYPTISANSAAVDAAAPITTLRPVNNIGGIFADSFETGLGEWQSVAGDVQPSANAVVGPYGGKLGMAATIGSADHSPAYVIDTTPSNEDTYDAHFHFDGSGASSPDSPVDIFVGLDQNAQPAFGVQFQTDVSGNGQVRGWEMQNGEKAFTAWYQLNSVDEPEDEINTTHKIEVGWQSGANGGLSLYVDDGLFATLSGDNSAYKLDGALLGPSMGLTSSSSGTMYFDEFTSSRINGLTYNLYLAAVSK